MQPLSIVTGIFLGTCASISLGLAVVALIALIIGDESPQLTAELDSLWRHNILFLVMTALCAAGFTGLVKRRPWRWWAQAAMWLGLAGTVAFYWPD